MNTPDLPQAFRAKAVQLDSLAAKPHDLIAQLDADLARLRFATLDHAQAWTIGLLIREVGIAQGLPIAIDLKLGQQTAFHAGLPGASADNDSWAARKQAVAYRYADSSLAVGLKFDQQGGFDEIARLPKETYAAHGGAIPLLLESGIPVGVAAVSGLPSIHDHALVTAAIAAALGAVA